MLLLPMNIDIVPDMTSTVSSLHAALIRRDIVIVHTELASADDARRVLWWQLHMHMHGWFVLPRCTHAHQEPLERRAHAALHLAVVTMTRGSHLQNGIYCHPHTEHHSYLHQKMLHFHIASHGIGIPLRVCKMDALMHTRLLVTITHAL